MQNSNTHSFSNILEYVKTELNEFDKNTEWLDTSICSNFLTSGSINIVSAGSGVGKTYFIVSFAIFLLKNKIINRVIHLNFDGNTDIFTARKGCLNNITTLPQLQKNTINRHFIVVTSCLPQITTILIKLLQFFLCPSFVSPITCHCFVARYFWLFYQICFFQCFAGFLFVLALADFCVAAHI